MSHYDYTWEDGKYAVFDVRMCGSRRGYGVGGVVAYCPSRADAERIVALLNADAERELNSSKVRVDVR